MISTRTARNLVPTLLAALLLGACDSAGPMAGNWSQVTEDGKQGMTITFDGYSDKISVHLAPAEDGTHGHAKGEKTYSHDAETGALTVRAELLGAGKPSTWSGKVADDGDAFDLSAGEHELKFRRGGEVHH